MMKYKIYKLSYFFTTYYSKELSYNELFNIDYAKKLERIKKNTSARCAHDVV